MKKLPIKYLVILAVLILTCSVISRKLSGKETLQDYAEKNPEVAYATREPGTPSPSVLSKTGDASDDASLNANASASGGVSLDTNASAQNNVSPDTGALPSASAGDPSSQNAVPFPLAEKVTDSIEYETGFFYQPLTYPVIHRITGISYPMSKTDAALLSSETPPNILPDEEMASLAVSYEDLRYMNILYYDFNGDVQTGELICNKAIAEDLIKIFYELYENEYQIESVRLIDDYNGDDTASMEANNTSCFNYRPVEGTSSLSKHALGCAIDINPFYNPYVVFNKGKTGETYISPAGSEIYADRSQSFAYKIDENDLCYKLFKEHGFTWGGNWNSCKDYQHFQKVPQ